MHAPASGQHGSRVKDDEHVIEQVRPEQIQVPTGGPCRPRIRLHMFGAKSSVSDAK
jgi:hypothetical protein